MRNLQNLGRADLRVGGGRDGARPSRVGWLLACAMLALSATGREKVIFDTDIGGDPDDGMALQYLLREPECDLLGITTSAGRPEVCARIASALCHALGRADVPIHAGCSRPFHRGMDLTPKDPPKKDGWSEVLKKWSHDEIAADGSAVEFLRKTIRANPGEVTLFTSCQYSNVMALFLVDPEIPSLLKRLVVVGGNFDGKSVEWNALVDVFATAGLLEGGPRRPPPTLILHGAEVTMPIHVPPDEGRAFMSHSPDFAFLRGHYAEQWYARPFDLFFHDPIAAVAIFHPEIMTYSPSAVRVDVEREGRTYRTKPGGNSTWVWQTATAVDFKRFKELYLAVMTKTSSVKVTVDASDVRAEVSPWIYGVGMEDVNHEIYGGLDAQRLFGESFEEPPEKTWDAFMSPREPSRWWKAFVGGAGAVTWERENPHGGKAAQRLSPNGCNAAVENAGLNGWGVNCVKGRTMRGWLYARGATGALSVSLRRMNGHVAATASLEARPGEGWKRLDFELTPDDTDPKGRFRITAEGYGDIVVDDVYLADAPTDAFGKIGCRSDIVQGFRQAGVNFLRWGGTAVNVPEYRFQAFPGDGSRPPYEGFWYRYASGGFGPREFVRLADAMALPCALAISVDEDPAEAERFADWTRSFKGFVAVQIGNEEMSADAIAPEGYRQYCAKARRLVEVMRRTNPRLKFISAAWWRPKHPALMEETFRALDGVMDYQDVHPWYGGHDKPGKQTFENARKARNVVTNFLATIRRWNPQTTMRAAVLEENGNTHAMDRALAHALMLETVRAAGGDILTCCAANALQPYGQNDNGWNQGNVFFTPDRVWIQPCAWANRMASEHHRECLVAGTTDDPLVSVSATRNRSGDDLVLHLVNATAEAKGVSFDLCGSAGLRPVQASVLSAGGDLAADNTPEAPNRVVPRDATVNLCGPNPVLEPYSYAVVVFCRKGF